MNKKMIAMIMCVIMLSVGLVGATLAWLTATSDEIVNTFTTSGIEVELKETTGTSYKMVPGATITKDPKATVKGGSEDCYLFVKIVKSSNFDDFMTYTIADGWTALTGVDGVYYRTVNASTSDQGFDVLAGNSVTVKGEGVTVDMMKALTDATYPTLTLTAYASQLTKDGTNTFTAAEAWANVNPTTTPTT